MVHRGSEVNHYQNFVTNGSVQRKAAPGRWHGKHGQSSANNGYGLGCLWVGGCAGENCSGASRCDSVSRHPGIIPRVWELWEWTEPLVGNSGRFIGMPRSTSLYQFPWSPSEGTSSALSSRVQREILWWETPRGPDSHRCLYFPQARGRKGSHSNLLHHKPGIGQGTPTYRKRGQWAVGGPYSHKSEDRGDSRTKGWREAECTWASRCVSGLIPESGPVRDTWGRLSNWRDLWDK